MTYAEFQRYMANYGFPACPLDERQYNICIRDGMDINGIYSVACDVNAGLRFSKALAIHMRIEPITP